MTTWYRTISWKPGHVEPVEVDRNTDKSVWVRGHKRAMFSDHGDNYFPTEQQAWEFMRIRQERRIEFLKADLQKHRSALGQIEAAIKKLPTEGTD